MMIDMTSIFPMILISMIIFTISKTHILNNLIIIEYLAILIITMTLIFMKVLTTENYLILYLTVLIITESIVGLSLMINMIRTHGNDFIKSSSVIKL